MYKRFWNTFNFCLKFFILHILGPNIELPVKVTGDINSGFTAEFIPRDVGVHSISVEYNGHPVNGTPFLAKAFNADKVLIGPVARGSVGQPTHFTGKPNN